MRLAAIEDIFAKLGVVVTSTAAVLGIGIAANGHRRIAACVLVTAAFLDAAFFAVSYLAFLEQTSHSSTPVASNTNGN